MTKTATNPWRTEVGRDCVDLQTSLAKWLGTRLLFMGQHANGCPPRMEFAEWTSLLIKHGEALLTFYESAKDGDADPAVYRDAQNALFFVTRNLGNLWD